MYDCTKKTWLAVGTEVIQLSQLVGLPGHTVCSEASWHRKEVFAMFTADSAEEKVLSVLYRMPNGLFYCLQYTYASCSCLRLSLPFSRNARPKMVTLQVYEGYIMSPYSVSSPTSHTVRRNPPCGAHSRSCFSGSKRRSPRRRTSLCHIHTPEYKSLSVCQSPLSPHTYRV